MTEQGGSEGSDWVEGTYESGADPEPRREGQPDGRGAEIGMGEASSFEPEEDEEQGSEQQPRDARNE